MIKYIPLHMSKHAADRRRQVPEHVITTWLQDMPVCLK
jgi:hypothetical protein